MDAATGKVPRDHGLGSKGGGASDEAPSRGTGGAEMSSTELANLQDAPAVPPEENMPAAPLLDGLLYRDEVCVCVCVCARARVCVCARALRQARQPFWKIAHMAPDGPKVP
eukprot:scaffold22376_cov22-Tisochrysis_lutea.AAC.1